MSCVRAPTSHSTTSRICRRSSASTICACLKPARCRRTSPPRTGFTPSAITTTGSSERSCSRDRSMKSLQAAAPTSLFAYAGRTRTGRAAGTDATTISSSRRSIDRMMRRGSSPLRCRSSPIHAMCASAIARCCSSIARAPCRTPGGSTSGAAKHAPPVTRTFFSQVWRASTSDLRIRVRWGSTWPSNSRRIGPARRS